jgi:hypothetical protein
VRERSVVNWPLLAASEAVARYRRGLAIAPRYAALWSNIGNVLKDLKHIEAAIVAHRRGLELEPDSVTSLHNLGIALTAAGRDGEALAAYDAALALDPSHQGVRWDRALSRLRLGQYPGGWQDYEVRFGREEMPKRDLPGARWTGEAYEGKNLLVLNEQGIGDGLWVARYLKPAKALGGKLIVECLPPSRALIASMGLADEIVVQGEPLPDAEYHIGQCSLPACSRPTTPPFPRNPISLPTTPSAHVCGRCSRRRDNTSRSASSGAAASPTSRAPTAMPRSVSSLLLSPFPAFSCSVCKRARRRKTSRKSRASR